MWPPRYGQRVEPLPTVLCLNWVLFLAGVRAVSVHSAPPLLQVLCCLQYMAANANQGFMFGTYTRAWRLADWAGALALSVAWLCAAVQKFHMPQTVLLAAGAGGLTAWQTASPTKTAFVTRVNIWHVYATACVFLLG